MEGDWQEVGSRRKGKPINVDCFLDLDTIRIPAEVDQLKSSIETALRKRDENLKIRGKIVCYGIIREENETQKLEAIKSLHSKSGFRVKLYNRRKATHSACNRGPRTEKTPLLELEMSTDIGLRAFQFSECHQLIISSDPEFRSYYTKLKQKGSHVYLATDDPQVGGDARDIWQWSSMCTGGAPM